jgi:MerR family copper efflux transcriptional regulator
VRIGELADQADVTAKTVRYYESIGIMPAPDRTPSGYRDYDDDALDRLRSIRDTQATGLTLAEIQSVLELKDAGARSCQHTRTLLDIHLQDLDRQIQRLQAARSQLRELAQRAVLLDPAECTDPNRCQVIDAARRFFTTAITAHGTPDEIVTDRAQALVAAAFDELSETI